MRRRRNWPELAVALAFAATGAAAIIISALHYPMGTVTRMGAGFVPVVLGILLVIMGAVLAWQSADVPPEPSRPSLRACVFIMGGILIWALLIDRIGFVPSTVALVICCALSERDNTVLSIGALSVGLCLGGYLIFIRGLGIPIDTFGG